MSTLVKRHDLTLTDGRAVRVLEYTDGEVRTEVGQINHTGHDHPPTPAARRACRQALREQREGGNN